MSCSDESREPCGLGYHELRKLPDEDIMTHLGAGHGDAVAVLLDRYSRLVLAIAFKIIHEQTEAEDVVQEVFVDLCRTAVQFDRTKGTAKMWIVRTAYRRSLTRRRNLKTRDSHVQCGLDNFLNLAAGGEVPSSSKLSSFESQQLVTQILGTLDDPQRRILECVFFQGLSLRDVAARTGASLESVRHRYYRSIDKLRKLMNEERIDEVVAARGRIFDAEA